MLNTCLTWALPDRSLFSFLLLALFCRQAAEEAERQRLAELERQRLAELRRLEVRGLPAAASSACRHACNTVCCQVLELALFGQCLSTLSPATLMYGCTAAAGGAAGAAGGQAHSGHPAALPGPLEAGGAQVGVRCSLYQSSTGRNVLTFSLSV